MKTYESLFRWSAIVVLLLTAAAKVFSATGRAPILDFPDALLGLPTRHLLFLVALAELAVVAGLISPLNLRVKYLLLAWLSTNFLLYRIAFYSMNPSKPCPCLGTWAERLHVNQEVVNVLLSSIVVYLLLGSFCCLRCLGRRPVASVVMTR